jgi:hypothetical protein
VVWDGTATTIELQYTCPGHQGHSVTIVVPAAGEPPPTSTMTPPSAETPVPTPTDSIVTAIPTDTPTATPIPTPTPSVSPTPCPSLSSDGKLAMILKRYFDQIPVGIASSGNRNNIMSVWDDQYDQYVCGSYQAKVLQLLGDIKFDADPCVRALLDDWDYGPIESLWGGHQAVVIYPHGTAWTDTGLVLDPWITQRPAVYTIDDWSLQFSAGSHHGIQGSHPYEEQAQYPTVGGNYAPPGEQKLTAAENAFLKSLPPAKQEQLKRMSSVNRKAWLIEAMRRRVQNSRVSVNSPLEAYVTDNSGRVSGFKDGSATADLSDVTFRRFTTVDGLAWTELEYPSDRGYRVVMVCSGEGQARVLSSLANLEGPGTVYQYDFEVVAGQIYQTDNAPSGVPVTAGDQRIEAVVAPAVDLAWLEARPALMEPSQVGDVEGLPQPAPAPSAPEPAPADGQLFDPALLMVAALAVCSGLLFLGLLAGGLVWVGRGRKTQSVAVAPQPQCGLPRRLVVVAGPQASDVFPLQDICGLGRGSDNHIPLEDPRASRRHARLERHSTGYIITDLGSGNGTLVNGKRIIAPTPVTGGDTITIGATWLKIE